MILKASQRGGGMQLYRHLTNEEDNDHVTLHDIRGFASVDPCDAVNEAYAISKGTKCRQYLFSLSLSPPESEVVPVAVFDQAIANIEAKLGLVDQPRFVYFHEKEGRRHAHCVWSRIDAQEMKAINLPHFKLKLRDVSRQLYLEQGWKMPTGLMNSEKRDPLSFTLADLQQAKRLNLDPRMVKKTIQECWAVSDTRSSFTAALQERGYNLAKGNKARHVVIDWRGEVYALPRLLNLKAKEVRIKIGMGDDLPGVDEAMAEIKSNITGRVKQLRNEVDTRFTKEMEKLRTKRKIIVHEQRKVRRELSCEQRQRRVRETRARAERLPKGIKALWFRLTGKYKSIKAEIEADAAHCRIRDQIELQSLVNQQKAERRKLLRCQQTSRYRHELDLKTLEGEVFAFTHKQIGKTIVQEGKKTNNQIKFRRNIRRRALLD